MTRYALLAVLATAACAGEGLVKGPAATPGGERPSGARGPLSTAPVTPGTELFRVGLDVYRENGVDGFCRFHDAQELACELGVLGLDAIAVRTRLPNLPDRGPCHVRAACWNGSVSVRRGDLILRGEPAVGQADERYLLQRQLVFFQSAAATTGVYAPFWGEDAATWDDGIEPLGRRAVFVDVELATRDGSYPAPAGGMTVVVRPTATTWEQSIDRDEAIRKYLELETSAGAAQLVGLLVRYVKWSKHNIEWIAKRPEIFAAWKAVYGVDFEALTEPGAFQYSPHFADDTAYTDLADERFWQRRFTSASRAGWALAWGWYVKQGSAVRDAFAGRREMVAGFDALFPARLAWWLVRRQMATIVDQPPSVAIRIRDRADSPWTTSLTLRAPVAKVDVSVVASAAPAMTKLRIGCDDRTGAVTGARPVVLAALCSFERVGVHRVTAELLSASGEVLAADSAVVMATPSTVSVRRGDVLVWITPARAPNEPGHDIDAYLAFMTAAARRSGVYTPFFGDRLLTWDDDLAPMGQRFFSGHVEIAAADDPAHPVSNGFNVVVLRPTAALLQHVDTGAAADRLAATRWAYSQPFVGVALRHFARARTEGDSGDDGWPLIIDAAHSKEIGALFGIDLDALPRQRNMQWSPHLHAAAYTDITSPGFWQRDGDCSSGTMWSLLWGWHQRSGGVDALFRDDLEAVAPIDAIAPGHVARWLVEAGLVQQTN